MLWLKPTQSSRLAEPKKHSQDQRLPWNFLTRSMGQLQRVNQIQTLYKNALKNQILVLKVKLKCWIRHQCCAKYLRIDQTGWQNLITLAGKAGLLRFLLWISAHPSFQHPVASVDLGVGFPISFLLVSGNDTLLIWSCGSEPSQNFNMKTHYSLFCRPSNQRY